MRVLTHQTLIGVRASDRLERTTVSRFDPKKFGRKLRAAREELGITQEELKKRSVIKDFDEVGISIPYISMLERGEAKGPPTGEYLEKFSRALNIDINVVKEWANIVPAPDWSATLKAIEADRNLTEEQREIISRLYLQLVPQRKPPRKDSRASA